MKKKNIYTIIILIISTLSLVFLTAFLHGFFSHNKKVDIEGDTGEIVVQSSYYCDSEQMFSAPGSKHDEIITIENQQRSISIIYFLDLNIVAGSGLENAILVFLNGDFIGNLGVLTQNDGSYRIDPNDSLYPGESITHTLTLQYHIGASNYFHDKAFTLSVECYTRNLTSKDKITYVNDFYQLEQIAIATNGGGYEGHTIKLSSDIFLQRNLSFLCFLNLDLNGKRLGMSSFNVSFAGPGISYLKDSRHLASIDGEGYFIIHSEEALLINNSSLENISVIQYNKQSLLNEYVAHLNKTTLYGVYDQLIPDNDFKHYMQEISFTLPQDIIVDTNGNFSFTRYNQTVIREVIIEIDELNYPLSIKVVGLNDSSHLDSVIQQELSYLINTPQINYNLHLPTYLKEYDCYISWFSTNKNVLSSDGKYTKPGNDTSLLLVGVFTINNNVYFRDFELFASGKDNKEKLNALINMFGSINISTIGELHPLPSPQTYMEITEEDFGIINLEYSFDGSYTFLNISNYSISAISFSLIRYAPLTIKATFNDGIESGIIDININLIGGGSLDALFRYLQNYFNELEEGSISSFAPPETYEGMEIIYYIPDSSINEKAEDIVNNQEIVNINGIENMLTLSNDSLIVNTDYLLNRNVQVYIIAQVMQTKRVYSFLLGGLLRNDEEGIPSAPLFNSLKTAMGLASQQTYISLKEISENPLLNLNASSLNINSIKGLQFFVTLENINLSNNDISDISYLDGFDNLVTLNLSNNNISNVNHLSSSQLMNSLQLQGNLLLKSVEVIKNYANLAYLDIENTDCSFVFNHWAFAYSYFRYKYTVGLDPNYWFSDVGVRTRYSPSPNEKEYTAAMLLANLNTITEAYDTLLLSTTMQGAHGSGFNWRVHSGSEHISITNNVATITRPTVDTEIIIILNLYAPGNIGFSVDRAYFITLRGTS